MEIAEIAEIADGVDVAVVVLVGVAAEADLLQRNLLHRNLQRVLQKRNPKEKLLHRNLQRMLQKRNL